MPQAWLLYKLPNVQMSKTVQGNLWLAVLTVVLVGLIVGLSFFCFRQFDLQWQVHLVTSAMITLLVAGILAICASAPAWMQR